MLIAKWRSSSEIIPRPNGARSGELGRCFALYEANDGHDAFGLDAAEPELLRLARYSRNERRIAVAAV